MKRIKAYKLEIKWDDGKTEGLAVHLPEYLHDQLLGYFQELEDLRNEHDEGARNEPYHFEPNEQRTIN